MIWLKTCLNNSEMATKYAPKPINPHKITTYAPTAYHKSVMTIQMAFMPNQMSKTQDHL